MMNARLPTADTLPTPAGRSWPRRHRRGLASLAMVLMIAVVASVALLGWQIDEARKIRAAQANIIVQTASVSGYGLHHWVHAVSRTDGFDTPNGATARRLASDETADLQGHGAVTTWHRLPSAWSVTPLIAAVNGDGSDGDVFGIVVLRPETEVDQVLRDEVASRMAALSPLNETLMDTVQSVADLNIDPNRDLVVPAWVFSRINPTVVQRSPHPNGLALPMATDLDLGGYDIQNTSRVAAETAELPSLRPGDRNGTPADALHLDGSLTFPNADGLETALLSVDHKLTLRSGLEVGPGGMAMQGSLLTKGTGAGLTAAANVSVTEGLSVTPAPGVRPSLLACRPDALGGCAGGDLDLTAATNVPSWSLLTVFDTAAFQALDVSCAPNSVHAGCLVARNGFVQDIPRVNNLRPEVLTLGTTYDLGRPQ